MACGRQARLSLHSFWIPEPCSFSLKLSSNHVGFFLTIGCQSLLWLLCDCFCLTSLITHLAFVLIWKVHSVINRVVNRENTYHSTTSIEFNYFVQQLIAVKQYIQLWACKQRSCCTITLLPVQFSYHQLTTCTPALVLASSMVRWDTLVFILSNSIYLTVKACMYCVCTLYASATGSL